MKTAMVMGLVMVAFVCAVAEEAVVQTEKATFGGGCYWCIEAVLQQLDGVVSVKSGFMGGHVKNPTYAQVCEGHTGHAEVVQIEFDPRRIQYEHLLEWFWKAHDPTQHNRQGGDVGEQYRSVIFYHTEEQKAAAEKSKAELGKSGAFKDPIVTQIAPASEFYVAKDDHQNYYRDNKFAPYCQFVIRPKLKKLGLQQ
jgi:peptide-methionine (S)-S-oxide reductase